jgi:hypothetical protein
LFIGLILGGYLSVLWGEGVFSMVSISTSALGGFLGIWAGYRLAHKLG